MKPERLTQLTNESKVDRYGNQVSETDFEYNPVNIPKNSFKEEENPIPAFLVFFCFVLIVGVMLWLSPDVNLNYNPFK